VDYRFDDVLLDNFGLETAAYVGQFGDSDNRLRQAARRVEKVSAPHEETQDTSGGCIKTSRLSPMSGDPPVVGSRDIRPAAAVRRKAKWLVENSNAQLARQHPP
jgi:hypothetical protein